MLLTGLVFFAATLPNLLLSPIAGTFVDRWDHKETMVVSDILRAAIVLILPVAAVTNIVLVYPLIFLVTSISVFFRPARVAILPQIVPERDLLSELIGAGSPAWLATSWPFSLMRIILFRDSMSRLFQSLSFSWPKAAGAKR